MTTGGAIEPPPRQSSALVIGASSLGTIFEWYNFYLYGLAGLLSGRRRSGDG